MSPLFDKAEGRLWLGVNLLAAEAWLLRAAHGTETLLELVDTSFGIDEGRLSSEEGVCVRSDTH